MRVDFDDTDIDSGSYVTYQGKRFTGEATEMDRNGNLISVTTYINGREDGPSQEWYPDGTERHRGTAKLGLAVGAHLGWHQNGQLATQREFDDHGRELSNREWDAGGKLLVEDIYRQ